MLGLGRSPYRSLEKKLGYRFRGRDLLDTALMHRSCRFERDEVEVDNQRLEFLGDAALGLVLAARLYADHPDENEGILTSYRSRLASGTELARRARAIDLGTHLAVGKGEEAAGGRERSSTLADALEAVLGAAYLDGGLRAVDRIVGCVFGAELAGLDGDKLAGNPKGRLQELCQRRWKASPSYRLRETRGPPHATVFVAEVVVHDGRRQGGEGRSKQKAESAAARAMLEELEPH